MSSPPKAPRRFKPQLVEQTTTTSSNNKPRRFEPQPVSTSTRSSRNPKQDDTAHTARMTSDKPTGGATAAHSAEPVPEQDPPKETPKPRRKFNVQPVETSTRNNRKQEDSPPESDAKPLLSHENVGSEPKSEGKRPRRKFAPQLIETASRSRKSGDTIPALLPGDKTNVSPGDVVAPVKKERPSVHPVPPSNTPRASLLEVPQLPQLKPAPARQGSMRPHPNTRANSKQHSFKVPNLPDIDSSESEESGPPSLSRSHGGDSDSSDEGYKDATRMRESLDQNFSGYLLALAARAAEKQLRDQAAAAFPNTDFHEPVAHYINRSDSEGEVSEPKLGRYGQVDKLRMDSGDEKAAMQEMRKHGEWVFEQQKSRKKATGFDVEFDEEPSRQDIWTSKDAAGPFTSPAKAPKKLIGGRQHCAELKQMRKAASPPMLGDDISFPRCKSPDHARFDVTQGADYLRKNVCYLTEQSNQQAGLWGKSDVSKPENKNQNQNQNQNKKQEQNQDQGKALWGGLCNQETKKPAKTPVGLVTPVRTPLASPRNEKHDPMSGIFPSQSISGAHIRGMTPVKAPPSPPSAPSPERDKNSELASPPSYKMLDWRLEVEARVEEEFNDAFVTQVYNYLSFGYPALAQKYDEELERVAKVPVPELREDDQLADAKGYVRLGEDEVDASNGLDEVNCKRWRALRRYIREWGRQMMIKEREEGGACGWYHVRKYAPPSDALATAWIDVWFQFRRAALRALQRPSSSTNVLCASRSFATTRSTSFVSPLSSSNAVRSIRNTQRISAIQILPCRTYATEDDKESNSAIDRAREATADAVDSARELASDAAAKVSNTAANASQALDPESIQPNLAYVGNIFFDTTEEMLRNTFEATAPVKSVKLIKDGRGLSKGFAYVEFENDEDVNKAIDQHHRSILDGRTIVVNYAKRSSPRPNKQPSQDMQNPPARTLFIGNMSYEMTDKDLNDLFRQVKNVLDVRVAIDRRTGQPRGFAHADFVDIKSAEEAAAWLKDQEFYGRRLKIDFTTWQNGRRHTATGAPGESS